MPMDLSHFFKKNKLVDLARIPPNTTRVREEEMVGLNGMRRARGREMVDMFEGSTGRRVDMMRH